MVNASCKDEKSFAYNRIINMVIVVVVAINGVGSLSVILEVEGACGESTV
ncbi:hypothetical protein Hanom_Chr01g00064711 [Helianthus anomalus]